MARHWREIYDWTLHRDRMVGGGPPPAKSPDSNIIPQYVYFVAVSSVDLEFHSLDQLRAALDYFSQKIHPSSRIPHFPSGSIYHYEAQRWYDRLPMKLLKEPQRLKVVKALSAALADFSRNPDTAI